MYVPAQFAEDRAEVLHALMRARPLATLVTLSSAGLEANHIPLHLDTEPAPFGTLRGHVARTNPVWRDLAGGCEALAIFHGPEAYVSPSWYPSKAEDGKAVPTWNYAVVHARGRLRVVEDPAWLRAHLEAAVEQHEGPRAEPWGLADAPADYTARLMTAIVGLELVITRLEGKWKASQNQPPRNRLGVIAGLRADGDARVLAMAALVEGTLDES